MFYQTDPNLGFTAKTDCYLFDLLKIHELVGKHEFTRDQVKTIRDFCDRAEFIGEDGYINKGGVSGVASVASGITHKHVYMQRVDNTGRYTHILAHYARVAISKEVIDHFVLADFDDPFHKVEWDPWSEAGALTTRKGKVVDLRFIFAEAI